MREGEGMGLVREIEPYSSAVGNQCSIDLVSRGHATYSSFVSILASLAELNG